MKQKLLILLSLFAFVGGVKAEAVTVSIKGGANTQNSDVTWEAESGVDYTQAITLQLSGSEQTGSFEISVPEGYVLTGYSATFDSKTTGATFHITLEGNTGSTEVSNNSGNKNLSSSDFGYNCEKRTSTFTIRQAGIPVLGWGRADGKIELTSFNVRFQSVNHQYISGFCRICNAVEPNREFYVIDTNAKATKFGEYKGQNSSAQAIYSKGLETIKNASFGEGNVSWNTANNSGNVNFVATNAVEFFNNQSFDIYQEFSGLRNGKYKVSVQGFYRGGTGNQSNSGAAYTNRDKHNAVLYATGESTVTTDLANLYVIEQTTQPTVGDWKYVYRSGSRNNYKYHYLPNDVEAANSVISDPKFTAAVEVEVTDGNLRIGVKDNGNYIANQWVYLDDFNLEYLGNETRNYTFAAGQTELDLTSLSEIVPTKFNKENSPNALIFASNTTGIKDAKGNALFDNVVVKGADGSYTCDNLVLVDVINGAFSTSKAFTANTATYTRAASTSTYGTICLPFPVSSDGNIQYYSVDAESTTNANLIIDEKEELEAYTPAIYKLNPSTELSLSLKDVDVPVTGSLAQANLVGVLNATTVCENDGYKANAAVGYTPVVDPNSYYISANKFKSMNQYFNIKPFRAYLNFGKELPVRAESLSIGLDDVETAIDAINAQDSELKIFDLSGRRLEKLQKGVNIVNGKKVLVK